MKILQVAPYFIPYMGGQEKYVYNLSRHLVNNGHEVHVLTTNYPKSLKFEEIDGITVERQNVYLRPLRNPIAPGFIRFSKKIDEFDIVHMHNEYSFPVMLMALNKNKSAKYVLTNHIGKLIFENPFKDFFSEIYIKSMGKLIYNRSDAITVLSPQHKDLIVKIAPENQDKIKIISNAVDIEILEKLDNDTSKEKQDIFTILYVGQLIKRKGLKWLLMAIKLLKKENRNVKLIMVGDGEDENYFKKLVLDYAITDSGRIQRKN